MDVKEIHTEAKEILGKNTESNADFSINTVKHTHTHKNHRNQ